MAQQRRSQRALPRHRGRLHCSSDPLRSRAPETLRPGQGEPRAPLIAARMDFHKVARCRATWRATTTVTTWPATAPAS